MTTSKVKYENKIILDVSDQILNCQALISELKNIRVVGSYKDSEQLCVVKNRIKVGQYLVAIYPDKDHQFAGKKKSLWGKFGVSVLEERSGKYKFINYGFMKKQPWYHGLTHEYNIKDLSEIIVFCQRLNNLASFS